VAADKTLVLKPASPYAIIEAQRQQSHDRKEQVMAREDYDPDDARATRPTRHGHSPTDRLTPGESSHPVASDRNWRAERTARRRRAVSLPTSRQELALWLQYGGWRIISFAVVGVFVAILALFFLRGLNQVPLAIATPTAEPSQFNQPLIEPLATVTPVVSSTTSIIGQGTNASDEGAQFRVTGTAGQGLLLRPDHNTDNQPIATLAEGTIVTIIGDDFSGPDRVWKHVRDLDGAEGWAAADWLKPVAP
jgi:hypothetical protein